ncbi:TPM domain-containing protein [Aurantibacillus circumpalustris]|uniref:TPM domain-containing protein n=1 Tax=Aurantibacillus circumpalustris TaxID=3036359 RepID=UPI00295B7017|nr:TPM domain-containing protein [Aurantibacillus circumpalustris]
MPTARNFFSLQEQELLVNSIAKAELHTSGEIRLHLENFCIGSEIKAAQKVFKRLGMHNTKEKNGVLIYVATLSRKVAIIGDEGIHKKLGAEYWQLLVEKLIQQFKANKKAEGLAGCIIECGEQLGKFFPLQSDDKNELSNEISF